MLNFESRKTANGLRNPSDSKQFNEGVGSDTEYCYTNGTNEVFRFILCNYTSINIVIVTHCWCLCFLIFVLSTNDFPC